MNNLSIAEEREEHIALAKTVVLLALSQIGINADEIKEREAFREFGEAVVRSLVNEKAIKWVRGPKVNSPHTYSRVEIITAIRIKKLRQNKKA